MSPRRNWQSPTPLSRKRVCLPAKQKGGGGGQTRLRERGWGLGSPNSEYWRKSLALCYLFCA